MLSTGWWPKLDLPRQKLAMKRSFFSKFSPGIQHIPVSYFLGEVLVTILLQYRVKLFRCIFKCPLFNRTVIFRTILNRIRIIVDLISVKSVEINVKGYQYSFFWNIKPETSVSHIHTWYYQYVLNTPFNFFETSKFLSFRNKTTDLDQRWTNVLGL